MTQSFMILIGAPHEALNSRSVTLVQMANADPAAVPKLNRIGRVGSAVPLSVEPTGWAGSG